MVRWKQIIYCGNLSQEQPREEDKKYIVITDYEQSRTDTGFTKLILQITSFLLIGNTESGKWFFFSGLLEINCFVSLHKKEVYLW